MLKVGSDVSKPIVPKHRCSEVAKKSKYLNVAKRPMFVKILTETIDFRTREGFARSSSRPHEKSTTEESNRRLKNRQSHQP